MRLQNDRSHQEKLFALGEKLILAVLFLGFIDFQLYSLQFMVLAFGLYCLLRGKLSVTNGIFPMLLLMVSLAIFDPLSFEDTTTVSKFLSYPAAYLLGLGLSVPTGEQATPELIRKRTLSILGLLVFGLLLHVSLNTALTLGQENLTRDTKDIWSGETLSATIQAAYAVIPMGWCVAAMISTGKWRTRIVSILGLLIILYYNLTLSTRLLLLLFPILVAVCLLYYLVTGSNSRRKRNTLLAVIFLSLLFLLLYLTDTWGLRTLIEDSVLSQRYENNENLGIAEDSRWSLKLEYLSLMPEHLWGGNHIREATGNYAHDVFLDTYNEAGIFAFMAVIAIVWDSASKLIRLLRNPAHPTATKLTFLSIYVAVFIEFCFEPIIAGEPWLLMYFCFIHGLVTSLVLSASTPEGQIK